MTDLAPGSSLGGFRIDRVLGRGGMGVVYAATQVALARPVALKVIAPEFARDEAFRERFRREAMMAAAIDHPNIVPLFEASEVDGMSYLAMRFVRGVDLGALIDRDHQLDLGFVLQLADDVGGALDAAHRGGLVHRDVKPANVLIDEGTPGSRPHVFLTDFGLTKSRDGARLTQTGRFVGTVAYMAPEQIEGNDIDGRADLYALTCVLYECLTGSVPFSKSNEIATMFAHMQQARPRPSEQRPGLPAAVDDVIARGMAVRPSDRYATCADLARALRAAIDGLPTGERPTHVERTVAELPVTQADGELPTLDQLPPAPRDATHTPRVVAAAIAIAALFGGGLWVAGAFGGGASSGAGPGFTHTSTSTLAGGGGGETTAATELTTTSTPPTSVATPPPLVPAEHTIAAAFGAAAYLPTHLPAGYRYISWRSEKSIGPSAGEPYQTLRVDFGNAGVPLLWRVYRAPDANDCIHNLGQRSKRIGKYLVHYAFGNHGNDAWICLGSGGQLLEVDAWDPHALSPLTLMGIAGSAALAN